MENERIFCLFVFLLKKDLGLRVVKELYNHMNHLQTIAVFCAGINFPSKLLG